MRRFYTLALLFIAIIAVLPTPARSQIPPGAIPCANDSPQTLAAERGDLLRMLPVKYRRFRIVSSILEVVIPDWPDAIAEKQVPAERIMSIWQDVLVRYHSGCYYAQVDVDFVTRTGRSVFEIDEISAIPNRYDIG